MILKLSQVLTRSDLATLVKWLEEVEWSDGRDSAGWQAKDIKRNEQVPEAAPALREMRELVMRGLRGNSSFLMAARPKEIRPPHFARYTSDQTYGNHVDDPVMQGMRTDLSVTVFLSDPASYKGGELVIETASGPEAVKLPAGDAVLYLATSIHRVEPVRGGLRLVAVTWVRSLIRDAEAREILLDLDIARQTLFRRHGPSRELDLLSKCQANLMRRWVED